MKFIVIDKDQAVSFNDAVDEHPVSFVRFHSPHCGHCLAMKDEMKKLKNHHKIQKHDVGVIDAHSNITGEIKHKIGKIQHNQGVPAMYLIVRGSQSEPEEYTGERTADAMANFIDAKYTMQSQKKKNLGPYIGGVREFDTYDDGMGRASCKTECGDHGMGHGLASMVGLGHLTSATCEGSDGEQHACTKAQNGGKKRKTRKNKKKANKVKKAKKTHKKKTQKRKPKRKIRKSKSKTRKYKKVAKKQRKKSHKKRR